MRRLWEMQSASLPDEQAAQIPAAFPGWDAAGNYQAGDRAEYGGLLYKCLQSHTAQGDWTPEMAPSLWVRIDDPGEEWPVWRQPSGSAEAYPKGAKVRYEGRRWESEADQNVWVPGEYGWIEVV
ncbi:MAG: hypothetical protein HFK04_04280 [Oscillospiraceae bacterium]|nr:hypothetical protein [Oscillospiraceae bacterium]